ncbi:hypothetical protein [Bacillus atrophaeus]|uniref:hypothetical protein n=1 Tax=Bacillus atrophaeus TaxID=1452 RepID=UPI0022830778|nr:hypothetical protein [Bacillus atrophaeus]MCY8856540.1 hypothetical protein [Bacillus atrophaeus]MEC5219901.1 hypothetical protein [Bacillus atrophaeus]
MISTTNYNVIKDPKFLAFCSLATEGYGGNSAHQSSISFDEFCEKLEKNEVVKPENKKSTLDLNKSLDDWKSRFTAGGSNVSALDSQVLDIIKKAYNLGMVNKDNMLLRNEAINAYKNSI